MFRLKIFSCTLALAFCLFGGIVQANPNLDEVVESYIQKWIGFYPSKGLRNGLKSSAGEFENFSTERVTAWIAYNNDTLKSVDSVSDLSVNEQIDARVLRRQIRLELERWQQDNVLVNQPVWYAGLISQALTYIVVREQFTPEEKLQATLQRLRGVQSLCTLGTTNLQNGSRERTQRAVEILERTMVFYRDSLPELSRAWSGGKQHEQTSQVIQDSVNSVAGLVRHIRENVLPHASIPDRFDGEDYARKLRIFTDSDLTPAQLRDSASAEIEEVRRLMVTEAKAWWHEQAAQSAIPADENKLLTAAMAAMEEARSDNRSDFLNFFKDLTEKAETFMVEKDLATVPLPRTMYVGLSPDHFSGAAVGGVYPTGPFNPGADTLFYLPSIPDDSTLEQKNGFYRSFNNHFNTMIIAHEIYPGHYMQYKVAVSAAPAVRSLFANGVYVEGWGTFSEELMLDAGWSDGDKLTRLAHLRKRLENSVRAYTSVMVHIHGWNKDQLMEFAETRGLLAPQFAINLWNRVMDSPLQIPSYFLGFHGFRKLWQEEQARLGDKFSTSEFVDGVLQAGPIPIDALALTFH